MPMNVTFTFDVDTETHAKLRDMAEEQHRTLAGQLRFIIDQYLQQDSKSKK